MYFFVQGHSNNRRGGNKGKGKGRFAANLSKGFGKGGGKRKATWDPYAEIPQPQRKRRCVLIASCGKASGVSFAGTIAKEQSFRN